ncbi:MAG TPA: hypothetical protein ENK57_20075 [Polyangiaceae bacterium]|nr:hypothetical protein [Polyangiaceae bacterium]
MSMRAAFLMSALLAASGCGGGDAADEPTTVDTTGGETEAVVVAEPEPEPEPIPEPEPASGPAQITVSNSVGGAEGGGTVEVVDAQGEVVASGDSGQTFNVESGTYSIRGTITDASVLIDTPTREAEDYVTVPPGETTVASVNFAVSRILIRVRRGTRSVPRWRLTLHRDGRDPGEPIELEPSSEHVPITPGRYSGSLRFGGREIEVNGLIFQGGARMTVPVDVN